MQAGYFPGPQHPSRDRVGKPSSNKGVSWRVRENLRPLHWQAGKSGHAEIADLIDSPVTLLRWRLAGHS